VTDTEAVVAQAVATEVLDDLLGELPGDQFLSNDVAYPAETGKPGTGARAERGLPLLGQLAPVRVRLDQGFCPRLTWGFGRRSRRICRVRISA
jgi:hypothetical protein